MVVIGSGPGVLWCAMVASRPWAGQAASVWLRADFGLFVAAAVPVGRLAATEVANRPTASPAEAACALGVVWGHVLWL